MKPSSDNKKEVELQDIAELEAQWKSDGLLKKEQDKKGGVK